MRIVSAYKDGFIDPPIMKIMNYLQYTGLDFTAVVVTKRGGYEFNPELEKINGPWVMFDFVEYGWNWDQKETHLFGVNTKYGFENHFNSPIWFTFCDWVRDNPPLIYFKRELLQADVRSNKASDFEWETQVLPIEYPCFVNIPEPQSFEDFTARPISVFNAWGESHPDRVKLHGQMFLDQSKYGYHLIDHILNIEGCFNDVPAGKRQVWLSDMIPHYARYDLSEILMVNGISKISVSVPGAGVKCFRHSESPVNSVMLMIRDNLAWSYPWKSAFNCLSPDNIDLSFGVIEMALGYNETLYTIYKNGVSNCRNYHIDNYVPNYILKTIEEAL